MQIPHQTYKIDLNNINEPLTRMIESVNDKGVRFVDVELWANSQKVTLPQNSTATAAFVTDGFLINESVECAISDDLTTVIVPIDNAKIESKSGIMLVEIKITENGNILTPPFAFKVRVKKSITEDAKIFEKSYGTVSEILKEVAEARGNSKTLKEEIATKADKTEVYTKLSGKLNNTAGSVTTDNIASSAVTSDKIANGAITSLKLAKNAVSGGNIAQNQIGTNHLQSGAVTADKLADEVINLINSAGVPTVVNSTSEMIDTRLSYVLASTGTIWKYKKTTTTVVKEITEQINGDIIDNTRLASDGTSVTGTGYAGYVTTPFIDLLSYPVPFTLHLDGGTFLPSVSDNYTKIASYTAEQTKITCISAIRNSVKGVVNVSDSDVIIDDNNNVSILFDESPKTNNSNKDGVLKYVRFSGKGTSNTVSLYTTYNNEVEETVYQWVDTGVKYSEDTGDISEQVLAKISSLNNEGADPSSLTLLSQPVLDFYNSDDYPDNDYTITHLSKITYPCRADIPVPYTIKWAHNENAMRTTVAVDTKVIGAVNAYTMRTYDATGLDNYPIYNLLPNTKYYYKVTHVLSDGSLLEAKSGSFTTSTETLRLLCIDGTQNVRDLGGWTGLNGKKVKYGKLIRGASLSDSSTHNLILTGKGRLALAELKVTAELNLGAIDNETSIAANCDYYKIYYTNYATAITDSNARANFKTIFEKIIGWLSESSPRNVYMHCQGGCDRTGTLCFLLLGLLGVSESDLAKEYELSSFSDVGIGRLRTTTKAVDTYDYVGMVAALKTYSGDTITDKFVNFATTGCGISEETINSFRELMLD